MCIVKRSYEGNIPKFFISQILMNFMLFLPIWVIYVQDRFGLTLTQVAFLDFMFWISMALTEIPTGAIADTLGRKQSVLIGFALSTVSLALFGFAPNYPFLVVANSLWAFSLTFISGADMALFYDSLREIGRESEYRKIRGRLSAAVLTAVGISSGLGGLVAEIDLRLPFLITTGLMLIATLIVTQFKEPPSESESNALGIQKYLEILKTSIHTMQEHANLRYALIYASLLPIAGMAIIIVYIQPYAVDIGIPLGLLGFLSFGLRIFQIAGASSSNWIVSKMGEWNWVRIVPVFIVTGVVLMGVFNSIGGIIVFALATFSAAVTSPLMESFILKHSPGSIRATILSVNSLLLRLILASVQLGLGWLSDSYSLPTALIILGIGAGISTAIVLTLWGRSRQISKTAS